MREVCVTWSVALVLTMTAVTKDAALRAGAPAPPQQLTTATYELIKSRVVPTAADLAWQQVHWRDGFFEGLREAQARDMPIFLWCYFGDPRGHC
jgi:hypothetical protein